MKVTKNDISIGDIRFKLFSSLKLTDVYVGDLKNDTLLYAKNISASFSLWSLLKNRLQVSSVEVNDFVVHLTADSVGGNLSCQFFIDAFSSNKVDTTSLPNPFIVSLENILLVNGRASYDIFSESPADGRFDYNHIAVDSLQLATAFSFTSADNFTVKLKHLSLRERSGLSIQKLSANVTAENKRIELANFILRLTKSELHIDSAYIDYSSTTIDKLTTHAAFSLPVSKLVVYPFDVKMFYPPLGKLQDSLAIGLAAEGQLPAVGLDYLYFIYGRALSLDANAYIEDYTSWDNSPLELNIAQLFIDTKRLTRITEQLAAGGIGKRVELPVKTDILNLKAFLKGALPGMQVNLNLITSSGQLVLNGRGGYSQKTGDMHINGMLKTENFSLAQMLANPAFGMASLNAEVKGSISSKGSIAAAVNAAINRFDYNGYSYNRIHANALYAGDSVRLLAEISDSIVPLWLSVRGANISTENGYVSLEAKARHILFDTLKLIPQYKGVDLSANIRAEVQSFNLDKMKAAVSIDSLLLKTDRGIFFQDSVRATVQNEPGGFSAIGVHAPIVEAAAYGAFSFSTLPTALSNSLAKYFTAFIPYQEVDTAKNDEINMYILLRDTEVLSNALSLPVQIRDSAMVSAYYNNRYNSIFFSTFIPRMKIGESEFLQTLMDVDNDTLAPMIGIFGKTRLYEGGEDTIRMLFEVKALSDSANLRVSAGEPSKLLSLYTDIDSDIHFKARENGAMPLVDARLNPGAVFVNKQRFNIKPSTIQVDTNRYAISGFELSDTSGGNIKINGSVSATNQDTLEVTINQLYLSSIMDALRYKVDLKGTINADIVATEVLSNPIVSTNYFNVNNLFLGDKEIGNLEIGSAWDNRQKAVMLDAELWQANGSSSRINGYVFPTQNRLSLSANVRELSLDKLEPMAGNYLFGLSGSLGAELTAEGMLDSPALNGNIYFNNANVGVKTTNVQYKMTDAINVTSTKLDFNRFKIVDNLNNTATVTGSIAHKGFRNLNFDLNVQLQDFLLLNNLRQADNIVYGSLSVDGDIDITGTDKNITAKASISNSGSGKVFVRLPESVKTAERYTGIAYVNVEKDTVADAADSINKVLKTFEEASFPVHVELALALTPQLTAGVVLDAATGDIASVSGSGDLQLVYDTKDDNLLMYGDYTVDKGSASFSFQNILKRQFQLASGGKVTFRGDPMAARFTVTATYNIRADLASLDESFLSDPYLSSTIVPVRCVIAMSGDIGEISMSYGIQLTNVDESVQRKVDGLLYNDDLKIKEIAYLLALGRFYPPEGVVGGGTSGNALTTLLSSTLSAQLNSLLANVLNENWSVGTELRTGDNGTNNVEANVLVSANLFNNRVTVTTNLGYRNTAAAATNFTGDFSVEYKLTKAGDWVAKAYNVTNSQFYEQAPTTQGVGVIYKKKAKTFKELFKKNRRRTDRRNRKSAIQPQLDVKQRGTAKQENITD